MARPAYGSTLRRCAGWRKERYGGAMRVMFLSWPCSRPPRKSPWGKAAEEQEGNMWGRTSITVLAAGAAALTLAAWTGGLAPHAALFADNRPSAIAVDAEL